MPSIARRNLRASFASITGADNASAGRRAPAGIVCAALGEPVLRRAVLELSQLTCAYAIECET
jgi:hypothetical protein